MITPDKVVFSDAAWLDIIAETYERRETETGGILLGVRSRLTWYVLEAIDPGPKSIFEAAYFEYDREYTEHVANKIRRKYVADVVLIGLWHRHPGSLDRFSGTDDQTNKKYAQLSADGALSGLVNLDPDFRFTMYHVGNPLCYTELHYEVGDKNIPDDVLEKRSAQYLSPGSAANSSVSAGLSNLQTKIVPRKSSAEYIEAEASKATCPAISFPRSSRLRMKPSRFIISALYNLLLLRWLLPTNEYQKTQGYDADEIASIDDRLVVMLDTEIESNFLRQDRYRLTISNSRNKILLHLEDADSHNQAQSCFDFIFSFQNNVETVAYKGKQWPYSAGIVGKLVEDTLAKGEELERT